MPAGYHGISVFALYVKDNEVDALSARLATLKNTSKTEAVRLALQHELEREQGKPPLWKSASRFVVISARAAIRSAQSRPIRFLSTASMRTGDVH
jgi:hypothetical protein